MGSPISGSGSSGSGPGSANESSRGSFSGASGVSALSGLLSADAATAMASVAAPPSPAVPASPFTFLHTRRRNNSGPPGLLPGLSASPSVSRGMPEPGAPVAAFNVFGNRLPQPPITTAPPHANDSDITLASFPPSLPAPALASAATAGAQQLPSTLPAPISLTSHFEWERVIGRGSYGEVWLVRRRLPPPAEGADPAAVVPALGERVAIKKLLLPVTSMAERRAFLRRAELLKQIVDVYNGRVPAPPLHDSPDASLSSPLTSPKLRSLNGAAHVVPASPKTASLLLGASVAAAASAPFLWPAHLLEHRSIWQEDGHFFTETEACPLGDLFQFFAFGAVLDARQRAQAMDADADGEAESPASSVCSSSDDDTDEDESMGVGGGGGTRARRRGASPHHPLLRLAAPPPWPP